MGEGTVIVCTKCHLEKDSSEFPSDKRKRNGKSSWCLECQRARCREYKARPEFDRRESDQRYYAAHWSDVRTHQVEVRLKSRYGISLSDYEAMFAQQNGVCKICRKSLQRDRNTHVDHNHETGRVRGLLCVRCNFKLGILEDSAWCEKAASYLAEG